MRSPEPLDPVVARELEAIDAALAGAPDADAALVALTEDLRAVAPRLGPEARAGLDARVERRLAEPPRRRWRLPRVALTRRALLPALGAATALLAVVIVLGTRGGGAGDDALTSGGAGAPTVASEQAAPEARDGAGSAGGGVAEPAPSAGSTAGGTATPAPNVGTTAGGTATPAPGRRVERSVQLELGARSDRFDAVTDGVVRTTQRSGGFVAESQIGRDGTHATATFVLRIPTARLDAAVSDLSRLAHVRSIQQGTQDLTGAYDGTAARLTDARTQRRALVAALATAQGREADRLRARLAAATARVKRLERELQTLRSRTTYATIDLTVTATRPAAAGSASGGSWTPGDAWRDARRGLEVAAGAAILVLAFALPLGAVAAVVGLGAGAIRRRRREAALDAV
jgi:Domain of unknown function (DUF4349)